MEAEHDYIQWLFPLREITLHNPNAPIVNDSGIEAFTNDPLLRRNLLQSLSLMLRFYGLVMNDAEGRNIVIILADKSRNSVWLRKYNHNYQRLARILKCLMIFGFEEYAGALYECLL